MKLDRIQVDNFLGAHHIDVRLTTPVTLFAGQNGAAKSSIGEAVRMAMTGDVVRVSLKKEYEQLVTDGAKAGGGLITVADERTYAFNVPAGDISADDGLPTGDTVDVALNGQHFSTMTSDERRTFLFKLTGIRIKTDDIEKRMTARACDPAKITATLPLLRTGFPSACEFAKTKATESKGAWRTLTGETWGSKKSGTWMAGKPEPVTGTSPAADSLAVFDADIAKVNQRVGEVAAEKRTRAENVAKRAALETKAGGVDRVREALAHAQKELAEFEPKVVEMRQRASGTKRIGLVHDFAVFVGALKRTDDDAHNKAAAILLDRYEEEHGELPKAGAVDADAQASLPEFERGLEVMQNSVKNLERDLAATLEAKGQFDALEAPAKQEDLPDLDVLQASVAKMRADRAAAQVQINAAANYAEAVAAAEKKTVDAGKHHADVLAWSVVADALAPDGIPGDMLAEALEPVNQKLADAHQQTGWMQVCIASDMQITAAGRSYHLLSESEKWRTDAMIAVVVAVMSGLKILMLDRVDVLDLPGRSVLLAWLNALVIDGDIETALLFATLKALPATLYPTMAAHWVEAGNIADFKVAA